ncbi:Beta-glucanase [Escovopsis weberi]|uniref:Beta-glucanase n=1 Tax=Escovopsis weberi TaxID=150374 RepID=A0A0M8MZI1_ESCWE|nr:Beta-glucanase [Escovopsis weberi]
MLRKNTLLAALSVLRTASAWTAPSYYGFNLVWQDDFAGPGATLPSGTNWNIIVGNLGVNAELETYSSSTRNVQLSGGTTLQLVPWRDPAALAGWTSGRIESRYVFTPQPGKITRAEAAIRLGALGPAHKQGIWPAFWMLGDALRNGGSWPACGEIDILETVNGLPEGYGTLHCDRYPGGICNEGSGLGQGVPIPDSDNGFHTWRVEIDRTPDSWLGESIKWSLDGIVFHTIYGWQINNANVWAAVAHSPLFFILNVAVGGTWPGYPNANTGDGYGSMLEAGYVATYASY